MRLSRCRPRSGCSAGMSSAQPALGPALQRRPGRAAGQATSPTIPVCPTPRRCIRMSPAGGPARAAHLQGQFRHPPAHPAAPPSPVPRVRAECPPGSGAQVLSQEAGRDLRVADPLSVPGGGGIKSGGPAEAGRGAERAASSPASTRRTGPGSVRSSWRSMRGRGDRNRGARGAGAASARPGNRIRPSRASPSPAAPAGHSTDPIPADLARAASSAQDPGAPPGRRDCLPAGMPRPARKKLAATLRGPPASRGPTKKFAHWEKAHARSGINKESSSCQQLCLCCTTRSCG